MLKRLLAALLLFCFVVPLAGCVVYAPPPGRPGAVWVRGHYNGWHWVPGHWA
jgi:hypothetical protein